jgi:hypothetical protein
LRGFFSLLKNRIIGGNRWGLLEGMERFGSAGKLLLNLINFTSRGLKVKTVELENMQIFADF